jgi:hypothetical protein
LGASTRRNGQWGPAGVTREEEGGGDFVRVLAELDLRQLLQLHDRQVRLRRVEFGRELRKREVLLQNDLPHNFSSHGDGGFDILNLN